MTSLIGEVQPEKGPSRQVIKPHFQTYKSRNMGQIRFKPRMYIAELPDGSFSYQNSKFLGNFGMTQSGNVLYILWLLGIFHCNLVYICGRLVYFVVFWYICGFWVYFPHFCMLRQEKSGNLGKS
jgi:hypothetical protein